MNEHIWTNIFVIHSISESISVQWYMILCSMLIEFVIEVHKQKRSIIAS